jgi:predicted RNA-binding protein YlxR (DUF448 family)/uncharacterized membrane protein (Fun14 family)
MRQLDDMPIDPEMAAYLDAIDATLAGEPVDPRHAEVAELALLLADEGPRPRPEFVASLDRRAARRFAPAPSASRPSRARRRGWWVAGGWSVAATCAAGIVVAVLAITSHGGTTSNQFASSSASTPSPAVAESSGGSAASSASAGASSAGSSKSAAPQDLAAPAPATRALALPPNGRKVVQSAEIDLSTAPKNVETVAQEVFNVVGQANGIVDRSQVTQTGGPDGNATFQLRLPSDSLAQTLARLSNLRGATVLARTDNSHDVNSQYVSANHQLADDQALRNSLLKQLAAAVTTQQIDSLKAQLKNAEASIASDQAALRQLNAQINYSQVTVTINASQTPVPLTHHSSSGFTLGHAAHVAGRVLVVAAGVALIALAGLAPVALVVAILVWLSALLRRRRREQALDLA